MNRARHLEIELASARAQLETVTAERNQLQGALKRGIRGYVGRTVVVHQNGPSLRGILTAVHKDCILLKQAEHLDSETDLGGDIAVPRAQGVFIQIPDTEAA